MSNNEKCKGCLIYETMPNPRGLRNMESYCGLKGRGLCPCHHCLVKAMCQEACQRFREWRVYHPYSKVTASLKRLIT